MTSNDSSGIRSGLVLGDPGSSLQPDREQFLHVRLRSHNIVPSTLLMQKKTEGCWHCTSSGRRRWGVILQAQQGKQN